MVHKMVALVYQLSVELVCDTHITRMRKFALLYIHVIVTDFIW